MQKSGKSRGNPMDLLGGPMPAPFKGPETQQTATQRPAPAKQPTHVKAPPKQRPAPASVVEKAASPVANVAKAQQEVKPTPAPAPTSGQPPHHARAQSSPKQQEHVEAAHKPAPKPLIRPEFDRSPVHMRSLLSHHLKYYGFSQDDQQLLDEAIEMLNHDIRCKDRNNWLVFSPVGRDFLLVTNDKELSRAAQTKGSAVRLNFLDMLQEEPFPLGQLLLFREEFTDFFRPCSHLIALQVMSKALVKSLYETPVSRELILGIKHAVAAVYKKRNRPLTLNKLQSVTLAVLAEAAGDWEQLQENVETAVMHVCKDDF